MFVSLQFRILCFFFCFFFCFQAEDGIRDLVRSRGLGDVYKRQRQHIVDGGICRFTIPSLHSEA